MDLINWISNNFVVVLVFAFCTICFFFAILAFSNPKFMDRISDFLPFSKKKGGKQPPFFVIILIIIVCMVLAYYF